jgi:hypothetical protein
LDIETVLAFDMSIRRRLCCCLAAAGFTESAPRRLLGFPFFASSGQPGAPVRFVATMILRHAPSPPHRLDLCSVGGLLE